jgi:2-haloacid dehalogenase
VIFHDPPPAPDFDGAVPADTVKRLKPAPEPYFAVARAFDVNIADVRLVAVASV